MVVVGLVAFAPTLWPAAATVVIALVWAWAGAASTGPSSSEPSAGTQETAPTQDQFNQLRSRVLERSHGELEAIREAALQTKGLVAEAVAQLAASFSTINTHSKAQQELLRSMVLDRRDVAHGGETERASVSDLFAQTEQTLRYFVDNIVSTSKQSMQLVFHLDDVFQRISAVVELLDDVKGIARKTNLLALNASVEAARAGEHGRGFAVVATEVRRLAGTSDEFSEQINGVVTEAMARIREARDVIHAIASTDVQVVMTSQERFRQLVHAFGDLHTANEGNLRRAEELAGEIDAEVAHVVRNLQFEDIVRQLAERVGAKADALVGACEAQRPADGPAGGSVADRVWFENAVRSLEAALRALESAAGDGRGAVTQRSLAVGEVDLF